MMYVAQCHERYPYNQHEKNGHNYHLSSICAGIDYGQQTVVNDHIVLHKHVQKFNEELSVGVPGMKGHAQPAAGEYDSN